MLFPLALVVFPQRMAKLGAEDFIDDVLRLSHRIAGSSDVALNGPNPLQQTHSLLRIESRHAQRFDLLRVDEVFAHRAHGQLEAMAVIHRLGHRFAGPEGKGQLELFGQLVGDELAKLLFLRRVERAPIPHAPAPLVA